MKAEDLTAVAYFAGWRIVRWLPEKSAYRLFAFVADRVSAKQGKSFQRLESNLKRAVPDLSQSELRALAESGMRSYLRYWCDTFRSPDWDTNRIQST